MRTHQSIHRLAPSWIQIPLFLFLTIFLFSAKSSAAEGEIVDFCKPLNLKNFHSARKSIEKESGCSSIKKAIEAQDQAIKDLVSTKQKLCKRYEKAKNQSFNAKSSNDKEKPGMCQLFGSTEDANAKGVELASEHIESLQKDRKRLKAEFKKLIGVTKDSVDQCYAEKEKNRKLASSKGKGTSQKEEGTKITAKDHNPQLPSYHGALSDDFKKLFVGKKGYFSDQLQEFVREEARVQEIAELFTDEELSSKQKRELCSSKEPTSKAIAEDKNSKDSKNLPYADRLTKEVKRKAHDGSTGMCLQYVRQALYRAELLPHNNPITPNAEDAGPKLEQYGFRNIIREVGKDPYKAPAGAVLIYSGGSAGHAEIRGTDGRFYSDFAQKGPGTTWGRTLTGVYVK